MVDPRVVLAGAAVGAGLAVLVRELSPYTPDLAAALARLDPTRPPAPPDPAPAVRAVPGWASRRLPALAARLGLARLRADLDLLAESAETLAARKVGFGLLGLAFPPVLATAMGLLGLRLPVALPAAAALLLAAGLLFAPDLDLRRRAAAARGELRRTVGVYLELVALERAGDAGAVQALHRAAAVGDGPGFARLRAALTRAELAGAQPWRGLAELADRVRVPELADVADIMRLSGEDGAAVYATLRARAGSLRTALLSADAAEANAASEHVIVPVAASLSHCPQEPHETESAVREVLLRLPGSMLPPVSVPPA